MKDISPTKLSTLLELAYLFLRLGIISFGGPAVHIALMEKEFVGKRKWLSQEHFLDLLGATNLIPGPSSTQMTMHLGHVRAGWKGLIVAGLCFMTPAILITAIIAVLYKKYGQLPQVEPFLYGIKPAIIVIILAAILPLAKKSLKSLKLYILGGSSIVCCLFGMNPISCLFGVGVLAMSIAVFQKNSNRKMKNFIPLAILPVTGVTLVTVSNTSLFLTFMKIGSILYGSGYLLVAFLDSSVVSAGLLTRHQLLDAIAVGQFTPGPVLSTVTFVGYQINGFLGAIAATAGIFLPSFFFVALLQPIIPRMRKSYLFGSMLDALNVASIAIILVICIQMTRETVINLHSAVIGILSLGVVLVYKRVNTVLIILGGALVGYLLGFL